MKQRRHQLMNDINIVTLWHERYQCELDFLLKKKERVKEKAEELGEEALLYADDILNGNMEKRIQHFLKQRALQQQQQQATAAASSATTINKNAKAVDEGEEYRRELEQLFTLTSAQRDCLKDMSKKHWAFRILLETCEDAKILFEAWLEEGADRHVHTQSLLAASEKRVMTSVENNSLALTSNASTSISHHHHEREQTEAEILDLKIYEAMLNWHKYGLSASPSSMLSSDKSSRRGRKKQSGKFQGSSNKALSSDIKSSKSNHPDSSNSIASSASSLDVVAASTSLTFDADEVTAFFKQLCHELRADFVYSDMWGELMEILRVSRGGASKQSQQQQQSNNKNEGKQLDAHGVARTQANSDRYIDTDIMVPGSIQRLRIEVVEPKLVELAKYSQNNIFRDIGEISVATQYVYQLATPHLQVKCDLLLGL
jgi:hypothetical protein